MDANDVIEYRNSRFDDLERFGKVARQFLAWRFLDLIPPSALTILNNAESRVKSDNSIRLNFERGDVYSNLANPSQVPDLVGARISVFFLDHLEQFCTKPLFESLFGLRASKTLTEYSSDGYKSYHCEMALEQGSEIFRFLRQSDRIAFRELICELQVRTVIQHAFAESNHQLNYKYRLITNLDPEIRTKDAWLRASELLNQADSEITSLKNNLVVSSAFSTPHIMNRAVKFNYKGDVYRQHGCLELNGVTYGYKMLLTAPVANLPTVQILDTFFNIDAQFLNLTGIQDYKSKMWKVLEKNKPAEIRRITFDSITVRVADWNEQDNILTVQRSMYSDQVVSNHQFALDEYVPNTQTRVRDLNQTKNGALKSFAESPFSNSIGICCIVRTRPGPNGEEWILSHKGQNVAYEPGTLGCSAAGALEWDELGQWGEKDFLSWFTHGMLREFTEELGSDIAYDIDQSNLTKRIIFLGFGRDLGRSGKAQMFFFLDEQAKDFDDIKNMWRLYADSILSKPGESPEFKDIIGVSTTQLLDLISDDESIVKAAVLATGAGTSIGEEPRANAALALRHLGLI